jgi:GMP synthase-like glutamine amidotransferase
MPEDPAPIEVGLLECDHVAPHLLEIGGDYADMFAAAFARHAPHVRFVRYDAVGGHLPEDPRVHDAWLVTGSRWSVYDDEPWIAALLGFIRRVDAAGGVLVGVCFGHQAIAHALGGQTTRSERGWGVGVHEAALTARRPWMDADGAAAFGLLMTHQDQVRRLPPGASVLACSDHCEVAPSSSAPAR